MRRLLRLAARLYPRWWRARYGVEFDALLEDRAAEWGDVFDVLKGGVQMQISRPGMGGLVVLSAVCGLGAASGVAIAIPNRYVATGVMATPVKALSRPVLKGIIEKHDLYSKERKGMPLEEVVEGMRRDINFAEVSSGKFSVSFASGEPAKAQAVTRDLMERLGPDSILEAPDLPATAYSPNRTVIAGMGLTCGAAAGAVIAWIRRRRARA